MRPSQGFTLIEVLVALAILAIALSALLQNSAGIIRTTAQLEEKNNKHWVAMQTIAAIQLKIIALQPEDNGVHTTSVLGKTWYWKAQSNPTFIKTMNQITITVSEHQSGPFTDPLVGFKHE